MPVLEAAGAGFAALVRRQAASKTAAARGVGWGMPGALGARERVRRRVAGHRCHAGPWWRRAARWVGQV